jgi:DNA-binding CsgD family transcriptional regulator
MDTLTAALEDARSGRGRLAMLVGEPGIGKTRTAQELAAYAETQGVRVLWGRCHEYQGAPPYWPWIQAIRAYARERDPEQLLAEMGSGAAYISQIAPDIQQQLPQVSPPATTEDPEQARFRLFDSVASFFKNASRQQTLVIVLDNLHWADKSSLLLLEFVAQELGESPLLVVGTYRDVDLSRQHPLFETLGELAREGRFQRVLLRGLSQEDVGQFIESATGIPPASGLVRAVYAQTEGNPFFIIEVVRWLAQEGELTSGPGNQRESWSVRIPEGVREVIGRRLNRLSQQCNEALTIASVIGREFNLEQLGRLIEGLPEERLLESLEEALTARIIEEMPRLPGRYQFTHALTQQTLLEELSTTRRVRLHARIAEALEGLYDANAAEHAVELAYHFAEAEPVVGPEKLVKYSIMAGEQALAAFAWEEALQHFQRGLTAKGIPLAGTDPAWDSEAATLLFGLGRAQVATADRHQVDQAVASFSRAFEYYAEAGDVEHTVEIAERLVVRQFIAVGMSLGWSRIIDRAMELVPPDSHEAGRLLAQRAWISGQDQAEYDAAQAAFERALAIAQRNGDVALEMRTLANATQVDFRNSSFRECIANGLRAIELGCHVDDPRSEVNARYYTSLALAYKVGDLEAAHLHANTMLTVAERLRDRQWLTGAFNVNAILCLLKGDWDGVRDCTHRGLSLTLDDTSLLNARGKMEYQIGNFGEGKISLDRLVNATRMIGAKLSMAPARTAVLIPLAAYITGETNWLDLVELLASAVLTSPSPRHVTEETRAGLALMAVVRADITASGEMYSLLKSHAGTILGDGAIYADRLLGLLSHTISKFDQAARHFEDALAFCRKAGYRPELAWSLCDYADTLLQRDQPNDRIRARSLLEEALAISSELGMKPLMQRVTARLEQLESQPAPAPAYPNGLTQREVEVLRLIALGRSNPEIAQELFISSNTVAHHVTNILNKTNTANRAEAATYAAQHGLIQG